jgi:hypothetical protein
VAASTHALSHPDFLVGCTTNDPPGAVVLATEIVACAEIPSRAAAASLDGPGDIGDGVVLALRQHLLDCKMRAAKSALFA